MNKPLRILASLALIGATTLLLLEAMVRLAAPQDAPSLWLTPDPRYGHRIKPNFHQRMPFANGNFIMDVQTNSLGFRDSEPPPAQPGAPTILFAGDSFTFGHGISVEHRFDKLACAKLPDARCLNTGVSAWGTLQQTRFLKDHLDQLQPDIIVLTFCENDPHDDTYFLSTGVSFDRVKFPGKDFLRAHSHLFRFAQHLYLQTRKRMQMQPDTPAQQTETQQRAAAEQVPVHAFAPPISAADWQRTANTLRDFMAAFREKNPCGIMLVQTTDPTNEDIRNHFRQFAQEIPSVTFVDWADAAATLNLPERRLPYDGHWSLRMHELSADALAAALPELIQQWQHCNLVEEK